MSDIYTAVLFRRERTYLDMQAEVEAANAKGQLIDVNTQERWESLGETLMAHVPEEGRYIYVNGICHKIVDVTWSIKLPLPGQPSFDDPQVMLTLRQETPVRGMATPEEDFFK